MQITVISRALVAGSSGSPRPTECHTSDLMAAPPQRLQVDVQPHALRHRSAVRCPAGYQDRRIERDLPARPMKCCRRASCGDGELRSAVTSRSTRGGSCSSVASKSTDRPDCNATIPGDPCP
jgi:hypothetical protein